MVKLTPETVPAIPSKNLAPIFSSPALGLILTYYIASFLFPLINFLSHFLGQSHFMIEHTNPSHLPAFESISFKGLGKHENG